jgi:hypothetical protein
VDKPIKLKERIKRKYESAKDWDIREVKTIIIYQVTGSHEVWVGVGLESVCYLFNDNWQFIGRCN